MRLLDWDVFPAASAVFGQPTFLDGGEGGLPYPLGNPAVSADGRLFVAGYDGLKAFDNYATGSEAAQLSISTMSGASDVSARGSRLVILRGNRIYIYNNPPAAGDPIDVISSGTPGCGPNAMNALRGGAYMAPTGHLVVADRGNNRVLIWNPDRVPATGILPGPSVVVGQLNLNTCAPNDGNGDGAEDATANAFTLHQPSSVWSDGRKLVVVDSSNHRVLVWDQLPTQDFQPANWVVGQASFTQNAPNRDEAASEFTLRFPSGVDVNEAGQMAVTDASNNRVLVWDAIPSAHSVPADHVIGQSDFAHTLPNDSDQVGGSDDPGPRTLSTPQGARFHGRSLIVTDYGNHRVLVFSASN